MRGSTRNTRARSIPRQRLLIAVLTAAVAAVGARVEAASLPLTWNAPTTSADGTPLTDLEGYRIYLGTSAPACPGGSFHAVSSPTSTPASGQTVSARIAGLTAGTMYFARVSAVDLAGNESGCSGSASAVAQPDFTATPTGTTNFGSVTVNGTVDRTLTVQNTSTASLSVTASVGSPFSIVSGGSGSLAAGASRDVTVRFRPTTVGSVAGNVNFTAGGDTLSRALSGSGTAASTTTLTVTRGGTGAGTVSSSPAGISCGSDCTESVTAGAQFTLSASATSGSLFAGWSGTCSGTGTCTVTVNAATTVNATFNTVQPAVALTVSRNGTGAGTVSSSPAGISCGTDCIESLAMGTPVTLTASAASGSVFVGWGGACSGTAATCSWTMGVATAVTATFDTNRVEPSPVPEVSSLSPESKAVRSSDFTLTVDGRGFVATSVVRWNGSNRPTTFVSTSRLRATISAADLTASGIFPVSVVSPAPGGGTSASRSFSVTAPWPVVSSLSPATAAAGTTSLTLTVTGSGFVPASIVRWNSTSRPARFVSPTQVQVVLTAADLATAGSIPVRVLNPAPGGGTSLQSRSFVITASTTPPAPTPPDPTAPATPAAPTVTTRTVDATGVTFDIAWGAASGATSYRYVAGFADGSAAQQGTVTGLLSFQLRMPYHSSGAASVGGVCIRSIGPTGLQSTDQSCSPVTVPARPAAPAPPPVPAPVPSTPPGMPGNLSVAMAGTHAGGVTFNAAWTAASGATSYRYVAAFSDGSAGQEGTVTGPSMQLRMPYHRSGGAFGGFVCIRAANAAGQLSADHLCAAVPVPAP